MMVRITEMIFVITKTQMLLLFYEKNEVYNYAKIVKIMHLI